MRRLSHIATLVFITAFFGSSRADAQQPDLQFGSKHAVALRNNGDVLTWGDNLFCQIGRPSTTNSIATPEVMMRNVKKIAVAVQHSLALTVDGKLYGWGSGPFGMGNPNDLCEGPELLKTLADKTIVDMATGYDFSLAVTTDGDLYCTGANDQGQCPPVPRLSRSDSFVLVPFPELLKNVAKVVAGTFHALVLTKDGKLYAFGRARDGQLGNGRTTQGGVVEIADLKNVTSLAAGTWHSAATLADGSVWVWGNDTKSQLCDGQTTNRTTPAKVTLPGNPQVVDVYASGHATVMRTADGALYACGDNQFGPLGLGATTLAPQPTQIPVTASASLKFFLTAANSAVTTDGCTIRMSGLDDNGLINANVPTSSVRTFTPRANLTLCGARPPQPLPTLVRTYPKGGASGCWTPRVESDASTAARYLPLRESLLAGEALLKKNAAFLAPPEPSRFRTALSIGPYDESGARMHVKTAPERKGDGTRLWTGQCDVIPQIDRIGGAIFQASIFINPDSRGGMIAPGGGAPKLTGRVGGYPEYNNWVVITRDGRMPWIPLTLGDKLDAIGAKREQALAEWTKSRDGMNGIAPAAMQQTYEVLKKNDPNGAEKYLETVKAQNEELARLRRNVWPATTAELQKQVRDYQQYRASFTAEQLKGAAVPGDPAGTEKRALDAKLNALRVLTPAEQAQVDDLGRRSRDLERQAQTATRDKDAAAAARLRAESNELAMQVRTIRARHLEQATPAIDDANAHYELISLKPGRPEDAIGLKPDPTFPDFKQPNRPQVIWVMFTVDPDPKSPRHAWQQQIKDSFDYEELAKLLR